MATRAYSTTASRRALIGALALPFIPASVALGAAIAANAASPEGTISGTDAALFESLRVYRETVVARDLATNALDAAYSRYQEMGGKPKMPEALLCRDGDWDLGLHSFAGYPDRSEERQYPRSAVVFLKQSPCRKRFETIRPGTVAEGFSQEEIDRGQANVLKVHYEPWPEAQARADEIVAAWDGWVAEEARRREVSGVRAAEKLDKEHHRLYRAAASRLARTPAHTMEGIKAKVALILSIYEGDHEDLIESNAEETTDIALAVSVVADISRMNVPAA